MSSRLRSLLTLLFLVSHFSGAEDEGEGSTSTLLVDTIQQHRRNIFQMLYSMVGGNEEKQLLGSNPHRNWYPHCRRIGREVSESGLEIRRDSTASDKEPYVGMSIQVFDVESCDDLQYPSTDELSTTYQLFDPLLLELGLPPKHKHDYAYKPALRWYYDNNGIEVKPPSEVALKILPSTWWKWWFIFMGTHQSFKSNHYQPMGDSAFAGGSHGDVWQGRRRCSKDHNCDQHTNLILKRLKVEHGVGLLEAGLREIYFGNILRQVRSASSLFTTYVDHFFRTLPGQPHVELWIVFENAGSSLRSYIYTPISSESGFVFFQHSPFWRKLRLAASNKTFPTDGNQKSVALDPLNVKRSRRVQKLVHPKAGRTILREVLRQILEAAAALANRGIVHRDIKPSNVMCRSEMELEDILYSDDFESDVEKIRCVLGDFSSGWDRFSNQNLYAKGPSKDEQTQEYSPPETLIGPSWIPFYSDKPESYDSWSIGVLALELLLGTPNVFSVDQRTTALLENKMKKHGANQEEIEKALYLAALSQFCIFVPDASREGDTKRWPMRDGDPLHNAAMVRQSCSIKDFHQALRARDPLGIGFDSSADTLLHLIWKLLAWDPSERYSPSEALRHPFFTLLNVNEHSSVSINQNALESLMLDPRMDIQTDETVDTFVCPKCGRRFKDWNSCHSHAMSRNHSKFCSYDRSQLPSCLNAHTLLPEHPFSGYCDIQGRRKTIEDFHAVQLHPDHHFYGVFDGHNGNLAAKYVSSAFYGELHNYAATISPDAKDEQAWKEDVEEKISSIFEGIHLKFLEIVSMAPDGVMDQSGTTATIFYMNEHLILIASIGDSRAIMSSKDSENKISFLQLTENHVASNPIERELVLHRGGSIIRSPNGVDRVNGELVITRSIGDANLSKYLSRKPSVELMSREEMSDKCGLDRCFVVLASDGLWDVMSNQEVVDMVHETLENYQRESWEEGGAFQEAAERLTQEAYVRGSTDNIGVSVSAITIATGDSSHTKTCESN